MDKQFELQPTINIALIGHVSNGKSKTTYQITKTITQRYSLEKTNDMTIKLGYANAKIFRCLKCKPPKCYKSYPSNTFNPKCNDCNGAMKLEKHISIVDCPGHNMLMATMLNCVGIVDNTILIESVSNHIIPAPQTKEHFIASTIVNLTPSIVCMNKIDLVKREVAENKIFELQNFLRGTDAETAPLIPIVANLGYNIDVLLENICKLPEPEKKLNGNGTMIIIRSFNVNKQNVPISEIIGGVVGGSIISGKISVNDSIMILPGIKKRTNEGKIKWKYHPLLSTVKNIKSEKNTLQYATSGGLIALQLNLDPGLTTQDSLVGNMLIINDNTHKLNVFEKIIVKYSLISSFVGPKNLNISLNDMIIINVNSCNTIAKILKKTTKQLCLELSNPVCCKINDIITISKKPSTSGPRLIGRGIITKGVKSLIY